MMRRHIAIVLKTGESEALFGAKIQSLLESKNIETSLSPLKDIQPLPFVKKGEVDIPRNEIIKDNTELLIVIGGDGSILHASQLVYKTDIPILGINFGHFGFLTETEKKNIDETIAKIVDKDYEIEERRTIKCSLLNNQKTGGNTEELFGWGLNDIAINCTLPGKMINIQVATNSEPLISFHCDGVVVSTPTGSTGYSFSNGGPVIWPDVNCMLLSPIAAHSLFSRPLLIGDKSTFNILIKNHRENATQDEKSPIAQLSCDGNRNIELYNNSRLDFSLENHCINFAKLSTQSFASRFAKKFSISNEEETK